MTGDLGDFPGGPVVKNPPFNAVDADSIPGRGTKIPHAAGQLSLRATTTEPTRLRGHVLWNLRVSTRDDPACLNNDPMQPKIINKSKKKK